MILAAGAGTRLRPLTLNQPKPMLPLAGRPILEHTLAWLNQYGITQIAINLHHCASVVMEHFGNGSSFGLRITYSVEETLLGTAGGVKRMRAFFDGPFVVVFGDVVTNFDLKAFIDFHFSWPHTPHVSMSLYRVSNPHECGIVDLNAQGRVVRFVEKPGPDEIFSNLANAGVLVIDPEILQYVPEGVFYDLGRDLFPRLIELGVAMYGWSLPDTAFLIDIGTPEKYERAQWEWRTGRMQWCTG